jgi:hypothetical protein
VLLNLYADGPDTGVQYLQSHPNIDGCSKPDRFLCRRNTIDDSSHLVRLSLTAGLEATPTHFVWTKRSTLGFKPPPAPHLLILILPNNCLEITWRCITIYYIRALYHVTSERFRGGSSSWIHPGLQHHRWPPDMKNTTSKTATWCSS